MAKSGPHRPQSRQPAKLAAPNFIKNWRIYREMTVEQLAEKAGMSTGNISALENRRQGSSDEGREKLAKALRTTPAALIEVDPLADGIGGFWPLWHQASKHDRELLIQMAERLVEKHQPPKK